MGRTVEPETHPKKHKYNKIKLKLQIAVLFPSLPSFFSRSFARALFFTRASLSERLEQAKLQRAKIMAAIMACICCSSILSLVQFLLSFVLFYINNNNY